MLKSRLLLCLLLAVSVAAVAAEPAQKREVNPKTGLGYGFDVNAMDKMADPCVDFYQYACGTWKAKNPIPAEYPSWGRFDELYERNLAILHDILEGAKDPSAKRSPIEAKVGDFYAACMDENAVEKKGAAVLEPEMKQIAALRSKQGLVEMVAHLHGKGIPALVRFRSDQDYKDAESEIAEADQGGLTLPDRDYYVSEKADKAEIRKKYVAHVAKMFELLGDKPEVAAEEAGVVMAIETDLAKASQERVFRRDPANTYHKITRAEFLAGSPNFSWQRYLTAVQVPRFTSVNVVAPDFIKGMNAAIAAHPLTHWQTYLRWKVVNSRAEYLSNAFVNEDFNFSGKVLQGSEELRPRWKRCTDSTDNNLGEALGQLYVDKTFGAEGKQRMMEMVAALERALDRDIQELDWMGAATKIKAKEKLTGLANKIGYPEKWRDYSTLAVDRGDLYGDINRGAGFEHRRQLNKIGKPVDHKEWGMSPPTVNAYYSGQMNDINFPAGILQPPFFDRTEDDAVNFGGIGLVIGHEITHGFDDEGRKFDAKGNLNDWWTADDNKRFEERAGCIANEYSGFTAIDDMKLNGKLTLGENTADNGGARISFMALQETLANKAKSDPKVLEKVDGFTPEQRYFLGFGQVWCENNRPEYSRMLVTVDPHSPGRYRVNGVVQNMPEFQKAFGCRKGQPMVSENACHVW